MTRVGGRRPVTDDESLAGELAAVMAALRERTGEADFVPSLEPVAAVTRLMGDPQTAFQSVHITGTNGKSSTTRMIERLLREHGLRTGRFISPDLGDPRERIAIDGQTISERDFVAAYQDVLPYVELYDQQAADRGQSPLSYFEILVVMAFAAFADSPVDVAIVEVGMGGAHDATNVIDASVAVVTRISFDHERYLGHELATIAEEKSGIIKPGAIAVLSDQDDDAMDALLRRAADVGATVLREDHQFGLIGREVALGGQLLTLQGGREVYPEVFLPLHGEYQAHNAATALAAVEAFLLTAEPGETAAGLDPDLVRAAFSRVDSPGRLEVVRRGPTVLLDAAHNPSGAQALAESLEEAFGFSTLIGLVAILEDKDAEGILGALEPVLAEIVITRSSSPRAIPAHELGELAADVFGEERVQVFDRLDDALDYAMGQAEYGGQVGGGVLVTGSVTLVADARRMLTRRPSRQ